MANFLFHGAPIMGLALLTKDTADGYSWGGIGISPDGETILWAMLNPGHAGTATKVGYSIAGDLGCTAGTPATISFDVDIKPSGGSWTTIDTATGYRSSAGNTSWEVSGVYEGSVLMPCEVRIVATDTDATWYGSFTYGYSVLSFSGTVS